MSGIKNLLGRLSRRYLGPLPSFTEIQILDLILQLGEAGVIGRKRLAELLGLGEGSIRTMLMRLRSEGLVEVSGREGCRLTVKGRRLLERIKRVIKQVGSIDVRLPWSYPYNYVVLVKGRAKLVRRGLEQRDEGIRAGADAVMVLTYEDERLLMPGIADLSLEKPKFASEIIEAVKPESGDTIIIAGARGLIEARRGALAAAKTLL